MNWISNWKKIGIKVKQILKKQPVEQQETDWKNCPQCKKISYLPDLITRFIFSPTLIMRRIQFIFLIPYLIL